MKPRVAIPLPTSANADYNQRSWPQYAAAVERSGGQPVEIPLNATPVEIATLITDDKLPAHPLICRLVGMWHAGVFPPAMPCQERRTQHKESRWRRTQFPTTPPIL